MITTKFRSTVKSRSDILEHLNGTILMYVYIYIFFRNLLQNQKILQCVYFICMNNHTFIENLINN